MTKKVAVLFSGCLDSTYLIEFHKPDDYYCNKIENSEIEKLEK
jgi:7-cyano-7-deazaguanine synthase in queuosine biosynthesis